MVPLDFVIGPFRIVPYVSLSGYTHAQRHHHSRFAVLLICGADHGKRQSTLYGPFDQVHSGERAEPDSSVAYREAFSGCGRGRVRDRLTSECKGPADLR